MKKMFETIVFFGSGPVAAESLRLLAQAFTIEAVITKPRPAHHHGDVPVINVATQLNLPIFYTTDRQSLGKLFADRPVTSKVAVLIDFGIIVPQAVLDYFPLGIVNSHFSLLPRLRGADPITFAILNGEKETGVSLMVLVAKMDEGPLLTQGTYPLSDTSTTPQLTGGLIDLSFKLLESILPEYVTGSVIPFEQNSLGVSPNYSRKLTKKDGQIDWNKTAIQLQREVRAYVGWPKSHTTLNSLDIVITQAHVVDLQGNPGKTAIIEKSPVVYCKQQALAIDRLKPMGKKEMTGEAFLAGHKQLFLGA